MKQLERIQLLTAFLIILMKKQELVVDSLPVPNDLPPFNVAEDVYVTQLYNVSVCVIDQTPYEDGEFIPTIDPCESCICHPPGFACKMIRCKKVPNGCIQKAKELDDCCPKVICDESANHNLVYHVGSENDTIVWSTEETPVDINSSSIPDFKNETSLILNGNETEVNEDKFISLEPESQSEVASSQPTDFNASSEVSTSTELVQETSNVSKESLVTKELTEPTTMIVNYSIQLIVDSATFSTNIVKEDVRSSQVPINISLLQSAKEENNLLKHPEDNSLKIPSTTMLATDIKINKPDSNAVDKILETNTSEDNLSSTTKLLTTTGSSKEIRDTDSKNSTRNEESITTTDKILNSSLAEDNEDKSGITEIEFSTAKTTENDLKNTTVETTKNDFNESEIQNNTSLVTNQDDFIITSSESENDFTSSSSEATLLQSSSILPTAARSVDDEKIAEVLSTITSLLNQTTEKPLELSARSDPLNNSNLFISTDKKDDNQLNFNIFDPSGPVIFPIDNNSFNEHGMRPRDIETTTSDKNETTEASHQQAVTVANKDVENEKNLSDVVSTSQTIDLTSSVSTEETVTDIGIKEITINHTELVDISSTSSSVEEITDSDDVRESVESLVELENICPHFKGSSNEQADDASITLSSQESTVSEQGNKVTEEELKELEESSTESHKLSDQPKEIEENNTSLEVSSKSLQKNEESNNTSQEPSHSPKETEESSTISQEPSFSPKTIDDTNLVSNKPSELPEEIKQSTTSSEKSTEILNTIKELKEGNTEQPKEIEKDNTEQPKEIEKDNTEQPKELEKDNTEQPKELEKDNTEQPKEIEKDNTESKEIEKDNTDQPKELEDGNINTPKEPIGNNTELLKFLKARKELEDYETPTEQTKLSDLQKEPEEQNTESAQSSEAPKEVEKNNTEPTKPSEVPKEIEKNNSEPEKSSEATKEVEENNTEPPKPSEVPKEIEASNTEPEKSSEAPKEIEANNTEPEKSSEAPKETNESNTKLPKPSENLKETITEPSKNPETVKQNQTESIRSLPEQNSTTSNPEVKEQPSTKQQDQSEEASSIQNSTNSIAITPSTVINTKSLPEESNKSTEIPDELLNQSTTSSKLLPHPPTTTTPKHTKPPSTTTVLEETEPTQTEPQTLEPIMKIEIIETRTRKTKNKPEQLTTSSILQELTTKTHPDEFVSGKAEQNQTSQPATTKRNEDESDQLLTHSQTPNKASPTTDSKQSNTMTSSSPWSVVMDTIFSSLQPSSYDALQEN